MRPPGWTPAHTEALAFIGGCLVLGSICVSGVLGAWVGAAVDRRLRCSESSSG